MNQGKAPPLVVAFVDDLLFSTKIQNVVNGLDYRVEWLGQASQIEGEETAGLSRPGEPLSGRSGRLFEMITAWQPALLIFDLGNTAIPWDTWIGTLKSAAATRRIPVLAYGPHVDVEKMQRATDLGADAVVARSRFTADMPGLIKRYARVPDYDVIASACRDPLDPLAIRGIEKFNSGAYYACHDDLEEAWRQDDSGARDLYRGILQVGIAYHQIERGNYRGAVKMLLRVRQWLDTLPAICRGIDVAQLQTDASAVYEALVTLGPDNIGELDRNLFKPVVYSVE